MSKPRTSYLQNMNKKTNVSWPIMTLVSFLIILILIMLLLFSHFDTINTIINYSNVEKELDDLNEKCEKAKKEYDEVNEKLYDLKNELVTLNETEGVKLDFYNNMKILNEFKGDLSTKIYNSLNTRSILKKYGDYIYINKNNNVTFEDEFLFETNSAKTKNDLNDFYVILSKRLFDILNDKDNAKYIDSIYIYTYVNTGFTNSDLSLSIERANRFKTLLLSSSNELKNNFSSKFKVVSGEDSSLLFDKTNELEKNNRLEIVITLKENAIYDGIKNFVENE